MWGSIFDATKELAEKARKAAEELERNLNDSAGTTTAAVTTAGTSSSATTTTSNTILNSEGMNDVSNDIVNENDDEGNNKNNNNDDDDALNYDAWDDDEIIDIDIQNNNNMEEQPHEQVTSSTSDTFVAEEAINNHNQIISNDNHDLNDGDGDDDDEIQKEATSTNTIEPPPPSIIPTIAEDPNTSTTTATPMMMVVEEDDQHDIPPTESNPYVNTHPINENENIENHIENNDDTMNDDVNLVENSQPFPEDMGNEENIDKDEEEEKEEQPQLEEDIVDVHHNHHIDNMTDSNTVEKTDDDDYDTTTNNNATDSVAATTTTTTTTPFTFNHMMGETTGTGLISSLFGRTTSSTTTTTTTATIDHDHHHHPAKDTTTPSTTEEVVPIETSVQDAGTIPNPTSHNEEIVMSDFDEPLLPPPSLQQEKRDIDDPPHPPCDSTHESELLPIPDVTTSYMVDDNQNNNNNTHQHQSLPIDVSPGPILVHESQTTEVTNLDTAIETMDLNPDILPNNDIPSHDNKTDPPKIVPTMTHVSSTDDGNDENTKLIWMMEEIMSNEVSRKILEERYHLIVARDDDNNSARVNGIASIQKLQEELHQREQQLFSKTEQITMMEAMHENEKQDLLSKIQNTKDEAKRRIQKAKERVDAVELKLKNMTSQQSTSTAALEETIQQQSVLITELRKEGEKLAQKQADMELVVRAAKTETRELRKQITDMEEESNMLSEKLHTLEVDFKAVQNELSNARQGISQVDQLDTDLRTVREENEKRASTILTLEQTIKELKASNKEMENELKVTRKGAAIETEQERKRLIMEHNQIVSDMEMKLQATEREAAIREDALRVEIDDIRKRWQESVRRADTLSVDIQANTAPLLRQIDSINKQSRIRATAWAELETQLRNEIENSIVINEKVTKECNEWKTKLSRLDRTNKEYEAEVKQLKTELYDQNDALQKLQYQYDEALHEINQLKTSLSGMERMSSESVARVRSEMARKMVDNEEQYRIQIESIEQQLQEERNLRSKVEVQLMEQQSYKNHNDAVNGSTMNTQLPTFKNDNESQQRLRQSQNQADILVGALGGIVGNEYADEDDEDDGKATTNDAENSTPTNTNGPMNSYAALEELTSRLKASKMELSTLRTRLMESEKARNELLMIVDEARVAREQLPLVEQRVQELTMENNSLKLEIQGLKDDIADVRQLYRSQLNELLEAKALSDKNES